MCLQFISCVATAFAFIQLDIRRDETHELARRSLELGEIALENTVSYYQTGLLVGTPPQKVLVQIDTGSSDLWVVSAENPYCSLSSSKCAEGSTFDPKRSRSFKANDSATNFSITYGDATFAYGVYIQDDIEVGGLDFVDLSPGELGRQRWHNADSMPTSDERKSSSHSMHIRGANFALATAANSSEAVWGIGMESSESMAHYVTQDGQIYPTYSNLPMQMKEQGYIETVAYSLWLNDLSSSSGSLLFGAVDHAKYHGQLQKVPIVSTLGDRSLPLDFSVMLHGLGAVNSEGDAADIVQCSIPVLLDSGTTYTQLPRQLVQHVADTLGAEFYAQEGVFLINETQKQTLKNGGLRFNLSGIQIDVNMDELLIPIGHLRRLQSKNLNGNTSPGGFASSDLDEFETEGLGVDSDATNYNSDELDSVESDANFSGSKSTKARQKTEFYYLLGIFPIDDGSTGGYILGDTFLRSAYVIYDLENKEIALANSNQNAKETQIDGIGGNGIPSAKPAEMYSATATSELIETYSAQYIFNGGGSPHETSAILESLNAVPSLSAGTSTVKCCKQPSKAGIVTGRRHSGGTRTVPRWRMLILAILVFT